MEGKWQPWSEEQNQFNEWHVPHLGVFILYPQCESLCIPIDSCKFHDASSSQEHPTISKIRQHLDFLILHACSLQRSPQA